MKKIPCTVQSLICASNQLNNHSKAVEELVYNALDAGATSIAVRINIQENTIQVIDNGSGVCSKDFKLIGQKYMTSKFIDLSTLESLPDKYGFRGQSLANLTNVSKTVKIISRHEHSEETCMKVFENGKEKETKICSARPSKGTTVEVKGFLYNRNIQKESKDILSELRSIKIFLEHLSIIHSNISLSLRDDSKNEIVFKIHKNRDIHQTLSTLYNIDKNDFQELQVEKNEYKVSAFLRKLDNKIGKHLIFLNGKFISNTSKLHKTVNNNLNKHNMTMGEMKKSKMKDLHKMEENQLFQKKLPDYFIFIKCPYMDYALSDSSKQLDVEFKNWNQVNKLLDKLVNFFNGTLNLKEANELEKHSEIHKNSETRRKVKQIMENILGTHSKKPGIPHIHNGIKGKLVKRKCKKIGNTKMNDYKENNDENNKVINKGKSVNSFFKKNAPRMKDLNVIKDEKYAFKKHVTKKRSTSCLESELSIAFNSKFKKTSNNKKIITNKTQPQKKKPVRKISKTKRSCISKDVIRKFEMKTDSVKRRCKELNHRVNDKLKHLHEKNRKITVSENRKFNGITRSNINVAIRKQVNEILINDHNVNVPKCILNNYCKYTGNDMKRKEFLSNYDLLQTILKSQRDSCFLQSEIAYNSDVAMDQPLPLPKNTDHGTHKSNRFESENKLIEPMVTFQSHNYAPQNLEVRNNLCCTSHTNLERNNDYNNFYKRARTFMTKESRDNFKVPINKSIIPERKNMKTTLHKQVKSNIKRLFKKTSKLLNLKRQIMESTVESSAFTIDFTERNKYKVMDNAFVRNSSSSPTNSRMTIERIWSQSVNCNYGVHNSNRISVNTNTYTVSNIDNNEYSIKNHNWNTCGTCTIERSSEIFNGSQVHNDVIASDENLLSNGQSTYVSDSQKQDENEQINDPIYVCETVLNSQEIIDKEFEFSFNNRQINLSDNFNSNIHLQKLYSDSLYDYENEQDKGHNEDQNLHHVVNSDDQDIYQEVSHHFSLPSTNIKTCIANKVIGMRNQSPPASKLPNMQPNLIVEKQRIQEDLGENIKDVNFNNFDMKNRLGFLPKGMSPIFENCNKKNDCEYDFAEDYYENEMYNNFVENVRNNAEIFEPEIQKAKTHTTKAIDKVNAKLNKDNASLQFDTRSLKSAKVLGQIDEKFIAAVMKGGSNKDFLVLFDQHAIHERIRLEKNLTDYFNENQWKPVNIDEVSIKISKDDILYLHNYKDKFEQLGLRWTVLNTNEVSFSAIAEAILGKNPRQVDIVLKAVKNLITEEINIIKMQGGCVSLHPKSIMDLVFSEACRYAIKFGDKLSKSECADLLNMVSDCKTPFQCAHGRPVMAVLMELKSNKVEYKVNLNKVMERKGRL